ncbi:hypothetical protein [Aquipuribacter nitratireducens]|uniref:DGQHR domain-containing protein n=1 Tax=Aquipuribacter nitratireducens TaxID=650104 RepID=A0ABW0GQ53_9MICO
MLNEYRYPAFLLKQTDRSKPLVLFAAPAGHIDSWAGVPQRRRLAGEETVGWQREENQGRLKELTAFFSDGRNVVQNPLLCALQDADSVRFEPGAEDSAIGHVVVVPRPYADMPLLELLREVRERLATRVEGLSSVELDPQRLRAAIERARDTHDLDVADDSQGPIEHDDEPGVDEDVVMQDEDVAEAASAVFAEETQIVDFYQELLIRIDILERIGEQSHPDSLLGFSRDAMLSYLKPVVLVDGQHRLRGAVLAAEASLDSEEGQRAQMDAIDAGEEPAAVKKALLDQYGRSLPVSLLMDDSPSEHVFQFVVVNQKATPMGRALLGTIVSTSLSRDELEPVAERLRDAGIPLDDSQAVAYMTRAPESPFMGLVQTGVSGDDNRHLQWTVLKGLTAIFRELRGGKLYGQNNDYAAIWRDKYLPNSALVGEAEDAEHALRLWADADGPWRAIFTRFYSLIRDCFGDPEDMEAHNAWGNTASNLYNKISLTILAADYFQFLVERRLTLNSVEDVDTTVGDWLEDTNQTYFNRDWRMTLKKDQKAVKERWAKVWSEYRKNPTRLPRVENYTPQ